MKWNSLFLDLSIIPTTLILEAFGLPGTLRLDLERHLFANTIVEPGGVFRIEPDAAVGGELTNEINV